MSDSQASHVPLPCSSPAPWQIEPQGTHWISSHRAIVPGQRWDHPIKTSHGRSDSKGYRSDRSGSWTTWRSWPPYAEVRWSLPACGRCTTFSCLRCSNSVDPTPRSMDVDGNTKVHTGSSFGSGTWPAFSGLGRRWNHAPSPWTLLCHPCTTTSCSSTTTNIQGRHSQWWSHCPPWSVQQGSRWPDSTDTWWTQPSEGGNHKATVCLCQENPIPSGSHWVKCGTSKSAQEVAIQVWLVIWDQQFSPSGRNSHTHAEVQEVLRDGQWFFVWR